MSNPNRRRRPVWCGDVDTTRPGAAWDVQDDGCCGPCKPPVPGCGPVRPPMPQFPDCGYHIPPVQYVPGMNEQEQLANLNCKMNELIELFNCNTDKVFGAYEEVVRSAVCNDAFYKEITVESGYLADASTSYELVHIPFVDCAGQPIYMEMGLAYNNTTNSGVTESVFDKALEVYADKILPAAERSFQGVTIWKGAPIYSEASEPTRALIPGQCDYTLGVTENGYFKIYDTPNDQNNSGMIKSMRQDKVRNSMGCAVVIRGGEYVEDENLADMELPCTVMAMNYKTKERFILAIGKDNVASAITPEMIANLLKKYDVDVAALTSWGQQSYLLDKGQFSFMPTSTDSDGIPTVPQSAAFWYITKRRNFHNDYVKEVAALTIQMGENLWYDELTSEAVDNLKLDFVDLRNDLEQEIQDRKDSDEALGERIDKEIAERKAADTALDEKYAAEVARLDEEIDALEQRVTTEVTRLDALIQSTKEALTAKDVKEVKVTHDGTRDTYQVVLNDGTVLGADVIVYNYDQLVQKLDSYATVEQRLDAEIEARKSADDALNALITAEQQARANGDTALAEQIASVKAELTELIQGNTTDITALQGALDTLTQTVQSNYASLNERVTSNAENIANLQGSYGALQATVAALNETVTGLQQSFASTEQSFENVKQAVASMQEELNAFEERIEGELGNYLPLSGGTLTGPLDVEKSGAVPTKDGLHHYATNDYAFYSFYADDERPARKFARFGVGEPVDDNHAATKRYVDTVGENLASEIAQVGGQFKNYLPLSGGTMTGPLHINQNVIDGVGAISFYGSDTPKAYSISMVGTQFNFNSYSDEAYATIKAGGYIFSDGLTLSYSPAGILILSSNNPNTVIKRVGSPVDDTDAANKAYVDTVGENLASEIAQVGGQFENYLPLTGGTVTGATVFQQEVTADTIDMSGGPNGNILNAMTVEFEVTQQNPNGYAIMRNDTLQGFGAYNDSAPTPFAVGAPTQDYHATTKAYVDSTVAGYLPLSGGTMGGHINMGLDNDIRFLLGGIEGPSIAGHYTTESGESFIDLQYARPGGSEANNHPFGLSIFSYNGTDRANYGVVLRATALTPSSVDVMNIDYRTHNVGDYVEIRAASPTNGNGLTTKTYVDTLVEGLLYADGGRLYAHGDTPQDVLLDRLDFAPGGVESGGIVSLDCGAGSAGPILSVSDGESGLALLQAKTSDFSSNDDVMTLGAVCKLGYDDYSYNQPRITTFKVTSDGIITGTYMLRAPEGVWLINVSGSQEDSFDHAESRLIGSTADITVTVNDALTMTITFSLATHAVSISKVIGIAPLTLEEVS